MPFGLRNLRIGPKIGVGIGAALGAAGPLGVLIIGDSQVGRGNTADLTYRADPAYAYGTAQAGTYVRLYRQISQAVSDPWVPDITATDVAVQPYTGTGSVVFSGPSTGIGQELTRMQIPAVITEFAAVGLPCSKMVPAPSPRYPTVGTQWFDLMVAYQRTVEAAKGIQTRLIVVSAGNNDGLTAPESAALAANMALLYNALVAAFPGAVICWIKINSDTVNFPSFIAGTITNQTTEFGVLAAVKQIWCDDQIAGIGIATDHAHLTANGCRIYGTRALYQGMDALSYTRTRPAAAPIMVGDGNTAATDGTGAPTSDGNPVNNDLEIDFKLDMLVTNTFAADSDITGWTRHSTRTQNPGAGVGCRMTVYTRPVTTVMLDANHQNTAATSVPLDAPSTRLFNKILTYRGANSAAVPTIVQIVYAGTNGNTSSFAGPSLTTGGTNRRVVVVTMGFIAANAATTCTLTGLTGGAIDRNSVVVTPATAGCLVDIQSAIVAASGTTINITNVTTSRTITSPVVAIIELAS